jgi:hypothetical protein
VQDLVDRRERVGVSRRAAGVHDGGRGSALSIATDHVEVTHACGIGRDRRGAVQARVVERGRRGDPGSCRAERLGDLGAGNVDARVGVREPDDVDLRSTSLPEAASGVFERYTR